LPEEGTSESSPAAQEAKDRRPLVESQQIVETKEETAEECLERLKYLQADFENYKRRIAREAPLMSDAGVKRVVTELLTVLDELDCALASARASKESESIVEGVEMIRRKIFSILEKEGLSKIKAIGERFDPNAHEALMKVSTSDFEEGTVVEEMRPGYMFKGQVIRPSMVKVNSLDKR